MVKLEREEAREYLSELIGVDLEPLYIERPFSPDASSRKRTLHTDRITAYKKATPRLIIWIERRLLSYSSRNAPILRAFFGALVRLRRRRGNRQ